MKANEAPKKIYLCIDENGTRYFTEGIPFERKYIEYTRTDDFVNKACEWFKSHGSFTIGFDGATVRDFLNFINK